MIKRFRPDMLLVFDEGGVTGHSDHDARHGSRNRLRT